MHGRPARISHQLVPQDLPQGKVCALGYLVFASPDMSGVLCEGSALAVLGTTLFPRFCDIGSDRLLVFVEGPSTFFVVLYYRAGR